MNTYLGQKGYTIMKKELENHEIEKLKKDLLAKPHTPGMNQYGNTQTPGFPVYRESSSKLYVPRYYGIEHFGPAKESRIYEGDDVSLSFKGDLRDSQKPVVEQYMNTVNPSNTHNSSYGGSGLLELPCGFGKTALGLHICSLLKKKTLVIVHKEFLMNQWIERIEQFLPDARVGKIQGKVIDIENKDIVLGMLQSLSMKEYPESTFRSFGFVIIDEVHHISSEVFSCALFKIVTKYMLGLSATMNRKDGTTKVFKMFLGDVVYKGTRDEEHDVQVRGIEYLSKDEDFKEVKHDFRGNVQYSTMISKLCSYNRRSEFILRVLTDMLNENPEQQIMILAHNKNVLTYLHDAIKNREIATVGYYVGGMKEKALKESEHQKVIIATYSMAAEALDIKTLTTLIMATPKTDIEQAVGRILREKHSKPVVVDIIDEHQPFRNQWAKRKSFYKKHNYKIIHCTSENYDPDIRFWNHISFTKTKTKITSKITASHTHNNTNTKRTSSGQCKSRVTPMKSKVLEDISELYSPDDILMEKCLIKLPKKDSKS
jgi:superfamily II DNA or RNA helicase|tara:strand:+ start:3202 stop:4827 length:1626 start_codon:yes stop_codon:yes gene_type:complete